MDFTNDGVDNIDINAYTNQIDSNILLFNISDQIASLEQVRDDVSYEGFSCIVIIFMVYRQEVRWMQR